MPERRRPDGPAPAEGMQPKATKDAEASPATGLSPNMSTAEALEVIADRDGPEIVIRNAARQIIAASVSRSKSTNSVATNVRGIINKSPRWTMTGQGKARRLEPSPQPARI